MLAECDDGKGTREVALLFRVSDWWVRRVRQERRERGKVTTAATRRRRRDWEPHADWLREKIAAKPDATLMELVALAATQRYWKTSDATICRALKTLGLTLKKDAHRPRARPRGRCVEASVRGRSDRRGSLPRCA